MLLMDLRLFAAGAAVTIKGAGCFADGASHLARSTGVSWWSSRHYSQHQHYFAGDSISSCCLYRAQRLGNGKYSGLGPGKRRYHPGWQGSHEELLPDQRIFRHEGFFMVVCGCLVLILALDGTISRLEGVLFLGLCAVYLVLPLWRPKEREARHSAPASEGRTGAHGLLRPGRPGGGCRKPDPCGHGGPPGHPGGPLDLRGSHHDGLGYHCS
jgi:hypothetical protein